MRVEARVSVSHCAHLKQINFLYALISLLNLKLNSLAPNEYFLTCRESKIGRDLGSKQSLLSLSLKSKINQDSSVGSVFETTNHVALQPCNNLAYDPWCAQVGFQSVVEAPG